LIQVSPAKYQTRPRWAIIYIRKVVEKRKRNQEWKKKKKKQKKIFTA